MDQVREATPHHQEHFKTQLQITEQGIHQQIKMIHTHQRL
jgi:hypothetical protein